MNIGLKNLMVLAATLFWIPSALSAPPERDNPTQAADANNQLGCDLMRSLQDFQKSDVNVVVSPFSITSALRMVLAGARGGTADEIRAVLRLKSNGKDDHDDYSALSESLAKSAAEGDCILRFPNRLWGAEGVDYQPTFLSILRQTYGAELFVLNFADQPKKAVEEINAWIAHETSGRIRNLASPQMITRDTKLLLTNAVYFRGQWLRSFFVESTVEQPFHVTQDEAVTVAMMRQSGQFRYFRNNDLELLSLPYRGDRLSFVVLLPSESKMLAELVAEIDAEKIRSLLAESVLTTVDVSLPRFTAGTSCSLKDRLMQLGMKRVFDSSGELSEITGKSNLYLTDVAHQTFINVDEFGIEAASATGVVIAKSVEEPSATFTADRPFLFLLIDQSAGTVLFQGQIQRPASNPETNSGQQDN
ncbi:MAG: serpin family protein [Planctomycetaceae bacterium]|nr:serpin family protein [Planctomycetaceae bacterium]